VAKVDGRARIEGVAASTHESNINCHSNKVAEDAIFTTPCVAIIFDEAPRYQEVQSKSRHGGQPSSDVGGDTSQPNNICHGDTPTNKICSGAPRATHEQERTTNEMV